MVLPKTSTLERVGENFDLSFSLDNDNMAQLDDLEDGTRYCWNPEKVK